MTTSVQSESSSNPLDQAEALFSQGHFDAALSLVAPYQSKSIAARALASRIQTAEQQALSPYGLGLLEAFAGSNPVEASPYLAALKNLAANLSDKKNFKLAFENLSVSDQEQVRNKAGPALDEIISLSEEKNPEMFWEGAISFSQRLLSDGKAESAAAVLNLIQEATGEGKEFAFPELAQRAKAQLQAIQGQGSAGLRFEFLASHFAQDVMDYKTVLPMLASGMAFELTRTFTLGRWVAAGGGAWYQTGITARLASGLIGFGAEVSTFSLMGRGLRQLSGEEISWDTKSVGEDLFESTLSLGALKLGSFLGNQAFLKMHGFNEVGVPTRLTGFTKLTQWALPQVSTFVGMMASHKLEESLNLRKRVDNATTVTDTLVSMVNLGIGGHLGHLALGESYAAFQKELGIRADIYSKFAEQPGSFKSKDKDSKQTFPKFGIAPRALLNNPLLAPMWMMMGVDGLGGSSGNTKRISSQNDPVLQNLDTQLADLQARDPQAPEIPEHFAILADRLQELGDPRGEWIVLEMKWQRLWNTRGTPYKEKKEIEDRIKKIYEKINTEIKKGFGPGFSLGFIASRGFCLAFSGLAEGNEPNQILPLLESEYGSLLRELLFFNTEISPQLPEILNSPRLHNLVSLGFRNNGIDTEGVQAIAGSKYLTNLRRLDLGDNFLAQGVSQALAHALAESQYLTGLTHLSLEGNHIGDVGVQAIAGSKYLTNLKSLFLAYNSITQEGACALADSQSLSKLRSLQLNFNNIGTAGAQAILTSPYLTSLIQYNGHEINRPKASPETEVRNPADPKNESGTGSANGGNLQAIAAPALFGLDLLTNGHPTPAGMLLAGMGILASAPVMGIFSKLGRWFEGRFEKPDVPQPGTEKENSNSVLDEPSGMDLDLGSDEWVESLMDGFRPMTEGATKRPVYSIDLRKNLSDLKFFKTSDPKYRVALLEQPRDIGTERFPAGTKLLFKEGKLSAIELSKTQAVEERQMEAGDIIFLFPWGHIKSLVLSTERIIDGIHCAKGFIDLSSGRLRFATLGSDQMIAGMRFKKGSVVEWKDMRPFFSKERALAKVATVAFGTSALTLVVSAALGIHWVPFISGLIGGAAGIARQIFGFANDPSMERFPALSEENFFAKGTQLELPKTSEEAKETRIGNELLKEILDRQAREQGSTKNIGPKKGPKEGPELSRQARSKKIKPWDGSGPPDEGNDDGKLHAFAAPALFGLDLLMNGHPTFLGVLMTGLSFLGSMGSLLGVFRGKGKQKVKPEIVADDPTLQELNESLMQRWDKDSQDPQIQDQFKVIADRLQELGDARGAWIALDLKRQELVAQKASLKSLKSIDDRIAEIQKKIEVDINEKFDLVATYRFDAVGGCGFQLEVRPTIRSSRDSFRRFLQSEYTFFITELEIDGTAPGVLTSFVDVPAVAASKHFSNLRALKLGGWVLNEQDVETLARSETLRNLISLDLESNNIGLSGVRALANSETFRNLLCLILFNNELGAGSARALAESQTLVNLRSLDLGENNIGPSGARAIAGSETLKNLDTLLLFGNEIGTAGARAIAKSQNLMSLQVLDLGGNDIGVQGVRAIAASETLMDLRELCLGENHVNDEGARAIAKSTTLSKLETLNLGSNDISDEVLRIIPESPNLPKLVEYNGELISRSPKASVADTTVTSEKIGTSEDGGKLPD